MNNFDIFKDTMTQYLSEYGISVSYLSTLHEASLNDAGDRYLYNGSLDFETVSMDIFYTMMEKGNESSIFDVRNPVKFAEEHVNYILVCSKDKNANLYNQVKNHALMNQNYTPPFMQRLKDYIFKDAYVYTEDFFERKFVNSFTY